MQIDRVRLNGSTELQKVFLWSHNKFALLSCSLPRQQSGRMLHKIEFTLYWKRQTVKRAFMCFGMWPNTRREIRLPVTKPGNVSSVPFWRPSSLQIALWFTICLPQSANIRFFIFILLPRKVLICSILNFLSLKLLRILEWTYLFERILKFIKRTIPSRQIIRIQFFQRTGN